MASVITGSREPITKTSLQNQFNSRGRRTPDPVTQSYIDIACAIIEQAIDDMRWLERYGADSGIFLGGWVKRGEVLNFFYSKWFEELCSYALPEFSAEEVLYALKIGKFNKERNKSDGDYYSKYYSKH